MNNLSITFTKNESESYDEFYIRANNQVYEFITSTGYTITGIADGFSKITVYYACDCGNTHIVNL